jgi:hypothetical protein
MHLRGGPGVERDFRGYLECGILAHRFAGARCEDYGHERLIPFSCKAQASALRANARHMCEVAAHLTDHVLPHVPNRRLLLPPLRLVPQCPPALFYLHGEKRTRFPPDEAGMSTLYAGVRQAHHARIGSGLRARGGQERFYTALTPRGSGPRYPMSDPPSTPNASR